MVQTDAKPDGFIKFGVDNADTRTEWLQVKLNVQQPPAYALVEMKRMAGRSHGLQVKMDVILVKP